MAIWKCPECEGTEIRTYEWEAVRFQYDLDVPENEAGWDGNALDSPRDKAGILMAAFCDECQRDLTNDELALVAKSVSGLVLSGHLHLPVDPNSIKGYVIVNPEHFTGQNYMVGYDEPVAQRDYQQALRDMFYLATENDNEYLYVGAVLKVTDFTEIEGRYAVCEECSEVYSPKDHDECPGCAYELAL